MTGQSFPSSFSCLLPDPVPRYSKGPSAFGEDYFEGLQDGDVMIGDGAEYDL
jgi:hypothetical protein